MNIGIFASAFHPHLGGVEEMVRQLAHEFQRRGVSPVVITNRWPRSLPVSETIEGIPVHRLAMRAPDWNLRVRAVHHLTFYFTRRRMLQILRDHRIDLLHVQCVGSNGYYALVAKRALQLPLVVTAQGERTMDAASIYERSPFLNEALRDLLREAGHITTCSQNTLDDLEQWSGASLGAKASVIYNGVRGDDFAAAGLTPSPHPRPYILGIGRLVAQKGFDVLIRAFTAAGLRSHDLLIAGEGPERASLEALARAAGCGDRIRFIGRAERKEAVVLFHHCAFFVLPSRHEPMGIVNLEAMVAGKAVIASRTGGVPEIVIDGETGALIPPDDAPALAHALRKFADDPALCAELGAAGRRRAESFTWPAIAESYLDIYAKVLGREFRAPAPVQPVLASATIL